MGDFFADFMVGLKKATLLAGAAGTVLGIVVRRQFQWVEALTAAGSGIACVLFVAPAAVRWGGFKGHEEAENLASFICGLLGMYLVDFAFKVARDPLGAWERFRGRQADSPGPAPGTSSKGGPAIGPGPGGP